MNFNFPFYNPICFNLNLFKQTYLKKQTKIIIYIHLVSNIIY